MPRKTPLLLTFLLALVAFTGASCQPVQPTPTPSPVPPTATSAPTPRATPVIVPVSAVDPEARGSIRLILAVPDMEPVDVYVESALAASRLRPGLLTGSLPIAPGRYTLRVVPPGAAVTSEQAFLIESVDVEVSESVIIVLGGRPDSLTVGHFAEDLSPVPARQARVMVINAVDDPAPLGVSIDGEVIASIPGGGLPPPPQLVSSGRHDVGIDRDGEAIRSEVFPFRDREMHTVILTEGADGTINYAIVPSPTRRENEIRFVHASASFGPVDVYLDDQRVAENVAPRAATEWRTVSTRGYLVNLRTAGDAPDAPPVLTQPVAPQPDQAGTLVLFDTTLRVGSTESLSPRVALVPEQTQATAAGQARLIVFNAVDSDLMQVASEGQTISGLGAIAQGLASPAVSVPAGAVQLNLNVFHNAAGMAESTSNTAEIARVEFEPGHSYLYVATGKLEDQPPLLLVTEVGDGGVSGAVTATPTNPFMVRFIHALESVPEVDVYIGDDRVLERVKYGEGTKYQATDSTVRPVRVVRAGTEETVVQEDLTPLASRRALFLLVGPAEQPDLLQTAEQPLSGGASAQVRAIHAAPGGAPFTVDIPMTITNSFTQPGGVGATATPQMRQYVAPISFPALSAPFALRPGTYTLNVRSAEDGLVMLQAVDLMLETGKRYDLLVIAGNAGPELRIIVSEDRS